MDEWIKKMCVYTHAHTHIYIYTHAHTHTHTHTMEYYSAIKKDEILPFATTWMELEGIMLGEISQTKTKIIGLHSYEDFKRQNRCKGRETKII